MHFILFIQTLDQTYRELYKMLMSECFGAKCDEKCANCIFLSNVERDYYPAVRTESSNTGVLFGWSLAPDFRSAKTILAGNLRSFNVHSPEFL